MEYRVSFRTEALNDLLRIAEFIAKDNPVKAIEWINYLEKRAKDLAFTPRQGKKYKKGYLVLIVERGYKIFYRVDETQSQIFIMAIYEPQFPENRMRF